MREREGREGRREGVERQGRSGEGEEVGGKSGAGHTKRNPFVNTGRNLSS